MAALLPAQSPPTLWRGRLPPRGPACQPRCASPRRVGGKRPRQGIIGSVEVGGVAECAFAGRARLPQVIVAVAYRFAAVYVKFVGTHRQYDGIDADTVEME